MGYWVEAFPSSGPGFCCSSGFWGFRVSPFMRLHRVEKSTFRNLAQPRSTSWRRSAMAQRSEKLIDLVVRGCPKVRPVFTGVSYRGLCQDMSCIVGFNDFRLQSFQTQIFCLDPIRTRILETPMWLSTRPRSLHK